jgi:hypothetical protein
MGISDETLANFIKQRGVCHTMMALPFTLLKGFLKQKQNYGNSYYSPCNNIVFKQKNLLQETKILQEIITL